MAWPNDTVAVLTAPPQVPADRRGLVRQERLPDWVEVVFRTTIRAVGVGRVVVELDHAVCRHARGLVQPVDVLGDHGGDRGPPHELRDGEVALVRLSPRHRLVGGRQGFRLLEDEPHGGVLRVGRVAVAFSLNYSRHGLNLAVSVD